MNNFVQPSTLNELLDKAGKKRPTTEKATEAMRATVNAAVWQLFSRLMDILRMASDGPTIRPSHVYNVMRLASLLDMPLSNGPDSRKGMKDDALRILHGGGQGGTVMSGEFFSGVPDLNYNDRNNASYTNIAPTGNVSRGGIDSSFPKNFGGGHGHGSKMCITDASITLLLQEYRSRIVTVKSKVLLGEGTRTIIKRILENNTIGIIKSQTPKRPLTSAVKQWRMVLG